MNPHLLLEGGFFTVRAFREIPMFKTVVNKFNHCFLNEWYLYSVYILVQIEQRRQYKSNLKVEFVLRLMLTYLTYKNEIESLVFPIWLV